MLLVARGTEQDADAEIVAVEDHIDQDREGDDACPEQRQVGSMRYLPQSTWPPVAVSAVPANAIGRLPVAPGMPPRRAVGPSRSSL